MSLGSSISTDARRAQAYERLGVNPDHVRNAPQISPILKKSKISTAQAAEYLRGAEDSEARRWLAKYDELSKREAAILPFEAFCLAAGLSPKKMFQVLCGAVFEQSANAGQLIRAAAHPAVVEQVIKTAKTALGTAEKKMLLQASGMLPVGSKTVVFGPQTNIAGDQNNQTNVAVLPPVEDRIRRVQSRFGAVHVLPPAPEGGAA